MAVSMGNATTDELAAELTLLARGHRILEMQGHGDITLGHLSLRDPDGRGLWLKKSRRGLDEVTGPEDFVLIDFAGRQLENTGLCHSEWPIHAEIMKARPEVRVVGHTHPYYCILFSATGEALQALSHEGSNYAGNLPRFEETSGLINTPELGRALASALGSAPVVLLKNHGVTYVGRSVKEAIIHGIFIEHACRAQMELNATGFKWTPPAADKAYNRSFDPAGKGNSAYIDTFFDYFNRRLSRRESLATRRGE